MMNLTMRKNTILQTMHPSKPLFFSRTGFGIGLIIFVSFSLLQSCGPNTSETKNLTTNQGPTLTKHSLSEEKTAIVESMGLIPQTEAPPAVDFTLKDLGGMERKLSDYKGKVIMLNFWATWCPPCRAEMPSMQSLYKESLGKDFVMLAIDIQEDKTTVEDFIKTNAYEFPILLDTQGVQSSIYAVQAIPRTYLIDKDGRVIAGKAGAHDWMSPGVLSGIDKLLEL